VTEDERGDLITALIENPGKHDRDRILRDANLSDEERDDVMSLVEVADLLWLANQGAPPLEDDPVAMRLGIVPDRPDTHLPGDDHE
jgi:hypothetical protein